MIQHEPRTGRSATPCHYYDYERHASPTAFSPHAHMWPDSGNSSAANFDVLRLAVKCLLLDFTNVRRMTKPPFDPIVWNPTHNAPAVITVPALWFHPMNALMASNSNLAPIEPQNSAPVLDYCWRTISLFSSALLCKAYRILPHLYSSTTGYSGTFRLGNLMLVDRGGSLRAAAAASSQNKHSGLLSGQ